LSFPAALETKTNLKMLKRKKLELTISRPITQSESGFSWSFITIR
jgi:hypothetical protein